MRITYIVKPGDTLYSISNKFKTTVEKVALTNQLRSPLLMAGQQLVINTKVVNLYRQREYKPVTAYTATRPILVNGVDINTGLYPVLNFKPEGAQYPFIYVPIAEFSRVGAKVVWDDAKQLITVTSDYQQIVERIKRLEEENQYLMNQLNLGGVQRQGNTSGNIRLSGFVAEQGDWVYYRKPPTAPGYGSRLHKIRKDGTQDTKLSNDGPYYINVLGDWVYYREDLNLNLYKIKTDGTSRTKLSDDKVNYVIVVEDWIYYSNRLDGGKIYKIKTDGTNRTRITDDSAASLNIVGDWIYYKNPDNFNVYKIKTDGTGWALVSSTRVNSIQVVGNSIYFNWMEIYKMNLDGTNINKITESVVKEFNIFGDNIYYIQQQAGKGGHLYKVDLNGLNRQYVIKLPTDIYNVFDDWVYYLTPENAVYKVKTDGTQNQKLYP